MTGLITNSLNRDNRFTRSTWSFRTAEQSLQTDEGRPSRVRRSLFKTVCESKHQVIAPVVAQNTQGRPIYLSKVESNCPASYQMLFTSSAIHTKLFSGFLKFLVQENSTQSRLQEIEITVCKAPGASCSSCRARSRGKESVCRQSYKEHRLLATDNFGKEFSYDLFMFPDGCECYKVM